MTKALGRLLPRGALLAALFSLAAPAAHAQFVDWTDVNWSSPLLSREQVNGPLVTASLWMPPGSMPEAIAWSPATGDLFFGEGSWTGARIRRTTPGLVAPVTIVDGQSCIRGLAADANTGRVYWTTSNLVDGSRVHRCDPDGANAAVLYDFGSGTNLRGLVVDAAAGWIYLADFDGSRILRLKTDASVLETFLTLTPGAGPWGLVLDAATQRLFWCEYGAGTVNVIGTNGAGRTTVLTGRGNPTHIGYLPYPGIAGGGYLLWSEAAAGAQQMVIAPADGSAAYTTVLATTTYGGIAFTPGGQLDIGPFVAPAELSLAAPAPNPATRASVIDFSLPAEQHARLELVDVQGRRVATLVDGTLPAGRHRARFAPAWAANRPAAGVYFARLEAGGRQLVRKLVVSD